MIFTVITLLITLIKTCKALSNESISNEAILARQAKLRRKTTLFLALLITLSIGWLAGLIFVTARNTIVRIILLILYMLTGLGQSIGLFLFIGVLNPGVRQDWKRWLFYITCREKTAHVYTETTRTENCSTV